MRDGTLAALSKEYGDALELDSIEQASGFGDAQAGRHFVEVRNKNPGKVVKFLRLEVVPAYNNPFAPPGAGAKCDSSKSRTYAYSLALKPSDTLKLIYPSTAQSECLSIVAAFGRAASWRDLSFSSSAEPDDKDPFAETE